MAASRPGLTAGHPPIARAVMARSRSRPGPRVPSTAFPYLPRPAAPRGHDRRPGPRSHVLYQDIVIDPSGWASPSCVRSLPGQSGGRLLHAQPRIARLQHRGLQSAGPGRHPPRGHGSVQRRPARRAPEYLPDQSWRSARLGLHDHRRRHRRCSRPMEARPCGSDSPRSITSASSRSESTTSA